MNTNGRHGRADEPRLVEAKMEHVTPDEPETPPARWRLDRGQSAEQQAEIRRQRLAELRERAA